MIERCLVHDYGMFGEGMCIACRQAFRCPWCQYELNGDVDMFMYHQSRGKRGLCSCPCERACRCDTDIQIATEEEDLDLWYERSQARRSKARHG